MLYVEGLEEVVAGLAAEAALAPARAEDALDSVSERVEDDAYDLAPKLTGAMANSIETTVEAGSRETGPTVDYAPFVEFGTAFMAPQPFMGRAASKHED